MRTDDALEVMVELVAFVRVAEAGSFSAAARRHGLTPSAVSRQVARLEKTLGVSLLQRTTRQLRLTEAGLEVLERGRAMVAEARATLQAAEGHVGTPRGLVRLSAPKAFARHVLHGPLLSFLRLHPEVDLHLLVLDRPVDALREDIDLVVRMTDDPPQGMAARALMPVRQWVLASPGYLAARGAVRRPEDLARHSCLPLGEQAGDSRWRFVRDGDGHRGDGVVEVQVTGRYTVNHSEMRLAAIEAGLGVGCVPDFVARDALQDGRVVRVLPGWTVDSHYQGTAYLVFPASRHTAPKLRALIDHLVAELAPGGGNAPGRPASS
ncbi:LysR family transcriptional regulator [Paracidovorax avenae]|uniref:LysR family transcriptional regulator n=1 Tax=Paracidovorax avenae TaxID=80867 RepID=UPI0016518C0D|nr:LysR family transcriptional regulator [Paracidovorax avenae]